jgi:predicted PurR-regulated permease PerM
MGVFNRLVAWLTRLLPQAPLPTDDEEGRRRRLHVIRVSVFLLVATLIGAGCMLGHGGSASVALLWALACLATGAAVGFLFGVPRVVQGQGPAPGEAPDYRLMVNTNLEQISDWLTKILVGLGLTQLEKLPGLIQSVAEYMASALGETEQQAGYSGAVLVYFTVIGFFFGYLLTRLYLSGVFADAEPRDAPTDSGAV